MGNCFYHLSIAISDEAPARAVPARYLYIQKERYPGRGMEMSFIKKPFKKFIEGSKTAEADQYIDLGELTFEGEGALGVGAKSMVKVAEVYRYEDINELTPHVYNGNILIVDYNSIANDELALKRITNELKSVARDTGGDVAGIGKNLLIATPSGIKVDRTKIKGSY